MEEVGKRAFFGKKSWRRHISCCYKHVDNSTSVGRATLGRRLPCPSKVNEQRICCHHATGEKKKMTPGDMLAERRTTWKKNM